MCVCVCVCVGVEGRRKNQNEMAWSLGASPTFPGGIRGHRIQEPQCNGRLGSSPPPTMSLLFLFLQPTMSSIGLEITGHSDKYLGPLIPASAKVGFQMFSQGLR